MSSRLKQTIELLQELEVGPTLRRSWRDIRIWVWPVMLGLAWLVLRHWGPEHMVWRSREGVPPSLIVLQTARALLLPGAVAIAALVGLTRAWSGRSAVNGAYALVCLLLLLVFGGMLWSAASYRLYVNARQAEIHTHGVRFRTVAREEVVRVTEEEVVRRGLVRSYPVLETRAGGRIHVRGPGDWEWAHYLCETWDVPLMTKAATAGRTRP